MKKCSKVLLITIVLILSINTSYVYADPGFPIINDPGSQPTQQPTDPPPSPIDIWVYPALLLGIYFAFRIYYKKRKASLK